jgi:subtilisin family serine protease
LTVEALEDRLTPSLYPVQAVTQSASPLYQQFCQETISIKDVVAPQSLAQNQAVLHASWMESASLIGQPTVVANYPSYQGTGYSVAIIDTGIDYNNPAFAGRVIAGWNFVNNTANYMDDNGHGTAVAGVIGSSDPNFPGIAPGVNLIALKVLDASGNGTFGAVQQALDWVVAHQAQYNIVAVNMSLGGGNYVVNPFTFLDADLSTLVSEGVFISAASGNDFYPDHSQPGLAFPAVDPLVVSVGAVWDGNFGPVYWFNGARDYTTAPDLITSFTQRDANLDILAPGAFITTTYLDNTFAMLAGTSMAAPVVTGAAVLLHQELVAAGQGFRANEAGILSIMQSTGVSVTDANQGFDNVVNTGLPFQSLDLAAAMESVQPTAPPPSQSPQPQTPPTQTSPTQAPPTQAPPTLTSPTQTPPCLASIPDHTTTGGFSVVLSASDPSGMPLTFSAAVTSSNSLPYQLTQTYGLTYTGSYHTNWRGMREKWLLGANNQWYFILPSGELRLWLGSRTASLAPNALVTTLTSAYYANPSLLWNAQPQNPSIRFFFSGNRLYVGSPGTFLGSYVIQVTASDGSLSTSQSFTVNVI